MGYVLKKALANRTNYGAKRNTSKIKYIVIHYTANDGDTDENNGKHFQKPNLEVSAHYFVDDDSVTQSVPDNYTAWHCGAFKYKHKECRNANSIGIEICDDVKNGTIYPSAKTIENVVELTKKLMKQHNIPASNVIRHYDVTGKKCPAYWVDNTKWKNEFWNKLTEKPKVNIDQLVKDTLAGKYGNGEARKKALGSNYDEVQKRINAMYNKPTVKTYKKGDAVNLNKASLFANSTTAKATSTKTGTFYIYDGEKVNGRYRITNKAKNCGKKPMGLYVTGWVKL